MWKGQVLVLHPYRRKDLLELGKVVKDSVERERPKIIRINTIIDTIFLEIWAGGASGGVFGLQKIYAKIN